MAIRLQIIGRHGQGLGERRSKEFGQAGGTIGRSLESDWVLPDGQRYLSSRHASIDYRSGSYYIVDTSTNGVYVNDAERPVGRGNPQRLFTGDRLRIGEYEMSVEIDEVQDTSFKLADVRHVDAVTKAQYVPPPDPPRADLVPAHEITGGDIEMLLDEDAAHALRMLTKREPVSLLRLEEDQPPKQAEGIAPRQPAKRAPSSPANAMGALDAFFRGAGLPIAKLDDKQITDTMQRLGQVMRELVLGISDNLHVRTEHKNMLRVRTTTIQPQSKNPLKFSASVEEALNDLLFRESGEYQTAVEAVREAFIDIKLHQQHLLAALRTAVIEYVGRLDPDEVESKCARRNGLIDAANKLKYWDLYRDLYAAVTHAQAGQFPPQFLEALAQGYETESAQASSGSPAATRQAAALR
jgi:type VI secretion system FHA domain protein